MAKKKEVLEKKAPVAVPLSVDAREALRAQIEEERAYRNGRGNELPGSGDIVPFMPEEKASRNTESTDNIEKMERVLAEGTPIELKGAARTAAEKEVKELHAWIEKNALTNEDMDALPRMGHIYTRAVKKSKMQEVGNPQFAINCTRLKLLERSLRPDDPESGNIERLRKAR